MKKILLSKQKIEKLKKELDTASKKLKIKNIKESNIFHESFTLSAIFMQDTTIDEKKNKGFKKNHKKLQNFT